MPSRSRTGRIVALVLLSLASGSLVLFYPSFPSHNKDELFVVNSCKFRASIYVPRRERERGTGHEKERAGLAQRPPAAKVLYVNGIV